MPFVFWGDPFSLFGAAEAAGEAAEGPGDRKLPDSCSQTHVLGATVRNLVKSYQQSLLLFVFENVKSSFCKIVFIITFIEVTTLLISSDRKLN